MSIIKYKKGNLLDAPEFFIAHGCNCHGVMGSGVAKAIRDKWPDAYSHYHRTWQVSGADKDLLGTIDFATTKDKCILNMFTQLDYGREKIKYISYDAIERCFRSALLLIETWKGKEHRLAIPKIGAGLGGGDWDIISLIINKSTPDLDVIVYEP